MDKIKVVCSNDNIEERKYIIDVLLKEFLNIDYTLEFHNDVEFYTIEYRGKKINFNDDFFRHHKKTLSYLDIKNLPKEVCYLDFKESYFKNVSIIYGNNSLEFNSEEIFCGVDIFASSFFMLTRWEECFIEERTPWGGCDENEMYVVKNKIFNRSIVNEYCFLLTSLLKHIGVVIPNTRKFNTTITHDVDYLFFYNNKIMMFKKLFKLLLTLRYKEFLFYFKNLIFKRKDPFDCFDEIMDYSDLYGFKNHFYFCPSTMSDIKNRKSYGNLHYDIFDVRIKSIFKNIIYRKHSIGFHPTELTFNNYSQLKIELERLKQVISENDNLGIEGGRQHQLLYNSETFYLWDKLGLSFDSGMGFQFRNGFRSGCCYEYSLFDLNKRKKLNLIQKPFIAKDMMTYNLNPKKYYEEIVSLVDQVFHYQGGFIFLWHTNNLNIFRFREYKKVYFEAVKYMGNVK